VTRRIAGFQLMVLSLLVFHSPGDSFANGNYSHLWMATDALNYLEDGELKDLLANPDLLYVIQNGAMYPDGGYAVGDGYGEISHWEPFHVAYLEWIRNNFQPPWSQEAQQHIAFLMGMSAHGISDQLYDGMYLERHEFYDENGDSATMIGVDGATDACFAASQGIPMPIPEKFVPAEILAPLYETVSGHVVTPKTILQGQDIIVIAVMVANDAIDNPDTVAEYMEIYPFACGNQNNPEVPGAPPTHGPVIAKHWQVLWERLNGNDAFNQPLSGTFYSDSSPYNQVTDSSLPDSWVSFALPHGLNPSTVNTDTVVVTDQTQVAHPIKLNVYYGWNSHLVNIKPTEDWAVDTQYTVTISPPITDFEDRTMEASHSFTFSTGEEPQTPVDEGSIEQDVVEAPDSEGDIAEDTVTEDTIASDFVAEDTAAEDTAPKDTAVADTGTPGASSSGGCAIAARSANAPILPAVLLMLFVLGIFRRRSRWSGNPQR